MNKTLLTIGDKKDTDTFLKFYRQRYLLREYNFSFKYTDYGSILNDDFPIITTDKIIILLFFPFIYWDKHIETKSYRGIYGNKDFYLKFKKFWKTLDEKIKKHYKHKKIYFVNPPVKVSTVRDKELTKKMISAASVETPKSYKITRINEILELLEEGKKLYLKVRYGSMGKGITRLEKNKWYTNFAFKQDKILSRKSDYGWKFKKVTDNKIFLRELLKGDITVEDEISPWLIRNRKFDLRVYVCFGKVLYIYPRSNEKDCIITNISQGSKGENPSFLNGIGRDLIGKTERSAVKAAKAVGLNFAGVDIMLDSDKQDAVVIEVNAFPGFPKVRRFNLPKYLIAEIGKRRWR